MTAPDELIEALREDDIQEAYKRWPDKPGECTMPLNSYFGNIRYAFIAGIRHSRATLASASASSTEEIAREQPAECVSSCEDPECPYTHPLSSRATAMPVRGDEITDEMVEKAARAVWEEEGNRLSPIVGHRAVGWAQEREGIWVIWREVYDRSARAALEAVFPLTAPTHRDDAK